MTDHNRYASYRAHEFSGKRRWRAAVSAIAMIIASAMVMTVGTSAYADDAKFVKDMEDAQAQLAKQTETESDESLDSGFSVDAESNTAESSGDGLDFGALADWSRVEEANILDRIVAFVNEDGTHAVTSSTQNGAFAVADLNDLSEDSDDWQWRIVAVDEKKAKDDATSFSVYLQCVSNDEYVTVDEDGSVSFTEKKDDATALMLAFTDADAFDKALEQDSNTPLRENTFMLSVAADDSSDKKTDGRDFVLSDDDSDADSAADRVLTAKGDDNPAKTDASSLVVYALKDESDEVDAADEADADADADNGVEAQAELEATGFTIKKDTVSPKNTLINVFDYWDTTSTTPDSGPAGNSSNSYQGINNGHALRFLRTSTNTGWGSFNQYTGNKQVAQGIVANTLENGYPKLSGSNNLVGSAPNWWGGGDTNYNANKNESLAYLFDPNVQSTGKASYKNAKGLLSVNKEGYFEYNAATNAARLDTTANADGSHDFTVYNEAAICQGENGQFFPFNDPNTVNNATSCSANFNHFFGMTLVTSFTQQYGGHVSNGGAATTFEFSGDDDVWIFIDDVLVADAGGIHGAASISIDFSTGRVAVNEKFHGTNGAVTIESWLDDAFRNAGRTGTTSWNGRTFADGTEHTLKFYYMERGHSYSNLWVKYNMISQIEMNVTKVDQYGDPIAGAKFAVFPGRIKEGSDPKDLGVGTAEYKATDEKYYELSSDAVPSEDGLTITDGGRTFKAIEGQVYTTGSDGKITFLNNGSYYQADKMKEDFGKEFILREISVPSGYRTVADESVLGFEGNALVSKNKYVTGTVATPKYQVDASQELYKAEVRNDNDQNKINYFTINNDGTAVPNGTLFAVVQHRDAENPWKNLETLNSWVAIYGSDDEGYFSIKDGSLQGSIEAAKKQNSKNEQGKYVYEPTIFTSSTGLMRLNFEELPGEPDQYYSFVEQTYFDGKSSLIADLLESCEADGNDTDGYNIKTRFKDCGKNGKLPNNGYKYTADKLEALDKVRYAVTYYWSDNGQNAGTMNGVTSTNTWRVHSHAGTPNAAESYRGFDIQWGSNVRIPNVENRLYFQNFIYHEVPGDTDGQDANTAWIGAKFALYEVGEASDTTLYYLPTTGTLPSNAAGIYLNPDPKRDGVLTDYAVLIDKDGKEIGNRLVYKIADTSIISVEDSNGTEQYTIAPVTNQYGDSFIKEATAADDELAEYGANYFRRLPQGNYVLRQITPPSKVPTTVDEKTGKVSAVVDKSTGHVPTDVSGNATYGMNITEVPVVVTDTAVYANAGGNRDGVTVGNGAGYLVDTMNQFASQGMLDESLTWIAMFLRTHGSTDFASFNKFLEEAQTEWSKFSQFGTKSDVASDGSSAESKNAEYAISRSRTGELFKAMTTYLQYEPESKGQGIAGSTNKFRALFDYVATSEMAGGITGQGSRGEYEDGSQTLGEGEGKLRLYTDQGWSMANVYQDYTYGSEKSGQNTEFIDLRNHEITQLFSESTFVAFYNSPSEMPKIFKVEADSAQNHTWTQVDANATCEGINNTQTVNGATYCRTNGYPVMVRNAQFIISRGESNNKQYRTTTGWSSNDKEAEVFTSDATGRLRGATSWGAYETVYGTDGQPVKYTLEEIAPPIGYAAIEPITFWMENKRTAAGVLDASTTYIVIDPETTTNASVSTSGMELYIENRPSLSIVKVEQGTERMLYVQVPNTVDARPSLKDVQTELAADEENGYVELTKKQYDELQDKSHAYAYLVEYTQPVSNAKFKLKTTDGFWCKVDAEEGIMCSDVSESGATEFTSSQFGIILNPVASDTDNNEELKIPVGDYVLVETATPSNYRLVSSQKLAFSVSGGKFTTTTDGMATSDDGTVLYVENKPIPTIVKVEQGTAKSIILELNDAGKAIPEDQRCIRIAADGANEYKTYGTEVNSLEESTGENIRVQCFVGYGTTLEGATFTLSRVLKGSTDPQYYAGVNTTTKEAVWNTNENDAIEVSSVEAGYVLSITDGTNAEGTYTLTEVSAPDGYTFVSKDSIVFEIGLNGHIVNPENVGEDSNLTKTGVRVSENSLTLYVENKAGVQLPSTGGLNWYWLMLVAALAIAIGLGVRERMRRQMNNLAHTTGQSE